MKSRSKPKSVKKSGVKGTSYTAKSKQAKAEKKYNDTVKKVFNV